jgi:hypothetical protein
MTPASAIYEGVVGHRRVAPVRHSFAYRLYLPMFDLDELPEVLDPYPLWSARRPAPAWVRRADYLGATGTPLAEAARSLVSERTGRRPAGPVRLLAHPRYLGVGFNPVSFLFCYDGVGRLDALIAEVTNTPWGERHAYVLDFARASEWSGGARGGTVGKRMHVSPFMGLDQRYQWWVAPPGDSVRLGMRNVEGDRVLFEATLSLERRELEPKLMRRLLATYPPLTLATLARIYSQALRLRLKGAPWFGHPRAAR